MVSLNESVTFEMLEKLIQHKIAKVIPSVTAEGSKIIYEQFPSTADAMFQKTLDKRKQTAQNAAKAFSSGE